MPTPEHSFDLDATDAELARQNSANRHRRAQDRHPIELDWAPILNRTKGWLDEMYGSEE
jgi:hypothetical protein